MQLDVESLRTFLAVLDHGGMTPAAKHLNMSQSSVSWKIKRLEDRVGRVLVIRDGRSVRPSRDGRALLDDARELVEIHDRAVDRLSTSELTGHIHLGAIAEVNATRIASILGRFKRVHPSLDIEFITSSTAKLASMVDDGLVDVAVFQVSEEQLRPGDVILWSEELRWATCCETPHDSGVVPLVTFGEDCFYRPLSEPILAAHGIDYSISISVPTTEGAYAAIAAGLGVGVIGRQHLSGDVIEWERGASLSPLPSIHQVARVASGENVEVTTALLEAISAELTCPDPVPGHLLPA